MLKQKWYLECDETVPCDEYHLVSVDHPGDVIAVLPRSTDEDEVSAAFVTRAVNTHDLLLQSVREFVSLYPGHDDCGDCNVCRGRAVLKFVEAVQ